MQAGRVVRNIVVIGAVVAGIAVIALANATAQVVRAYVQNSSSMEPTLIPGDRILVRPIVEKEVSRGTVIVLRYPLKPSEVWIKRVAAVGGDHVRFHNKILILNGTPAAEPYAVHRTDYMDAFRDNFPTTPEGSLQGNWAELLPRYVVNGELVVPEGKYFVLGDNRDDSLDSRYFGFVDRQYILGKAGFIYYSWGKEIRWDRMFRGL